MRSKVSLSLLCNSFYPLFFWVEQLFLITYPICDTARLTLWKKEVLAPGAGHCRASSLISVQVIRQTAGHIGRGRRQTEWEWEEGGRGEGGIATYPPVWVCSPGGPLLCWTGMQRADNHIKRWIYVRTKWRQNNTLQLYVHNIMRAICSLFFDDYFWWWHLVHNMSISHWKLIAHVFQNKTKMHKHLWFKHRPICVFQQKKSTFEFVCKLLTLGCLWHTYLTGMTWFSSGLTLYFPPFSPSACNSSGCFCSGGQAHREPAL